MGKEEVLLENVAVCRICHVASFSEPLVIFEVFLGLTFSRLTFNALKHGIQNIRIFCVIYSAIAGLQDSMRDRRTVIFSIALFLQTKWLYPPWYKSLLAFCCWRTSALPLARWLRILLSLPHKQCTRRCLMPVHWFCKRTAAYSLTKKWQFLCVDRVDIKEIQPLNRPPLQLYEEDQTKSVAGPTSVLSYNSYMNNIVAHSIHEIYWFCCLDWVLLITL